MPDAQEIRKLVREQIAQHIDEAASGDELLMKEVWEQLDYSREIAVAKQELRDIASWLRNA